MDSRHAHHSEYGPLSQLSDDENDTSKESATSSTPASAASPTTSTSLLETSFTPLSMHDSDLHISRFGSPVLSDTRREALKLVRQQSADSDNAGLGLGVERVQVQVQLTPDQKPATPCNCTATVNSMESIRATAPAQERSCDDHDFSFSFSHDTQLPQQPKPSSPLPGIGIQDQNKDDRQQPKQQSAKHDQRPTNTSHQISLQCNKTRDPCNDSKSHITIVRPILTNKQQPSTAQSPTELTVATDAASLKADSQSNLSLPDATAAPLGQPLVRTRSSSANVALQHPVPDLNVRSGAYVGNIAQLEATAERFSMTSSIEDAIREAHQELKRSDSRRSSILAASLLKSPDGSEPPSFVKQSSIVDINNTARSGGYSPGGFVMSPAHSLRSGSRLRSGSKTSAAGSVTNSVGESLAIVDDGFPFLSRHGPGKASVRSVQSNKVSLPEIAEVAAPLSLTQEALDEADRLGAVGEEHEDDDTIKASAHQRIDSDYDAGIDIDFDPTPVADPEPESQSGFVGDKPFNPSRQHHDDGFRPKTSGSGGTYDQAQTAFGDFDGVHCDPDTVEFPELDDVDMPPPAPRREPRRPTGRPQSYFDPESGNQMMYYPARVPAMLNLPQKLSKNPQAAERKRRSQLMSHLIHQEQRQSKVWLPDPLEGQLQESPLLEADQHRHLMSPEPEWPLDPVAEQRHSLLDPQEVIDQTMTPAMPQEFRRPPRLTDRDYRKSQMSMLSNLPPQLRASAFFDLPATTPAIEVKDGSAMKTLDSILDAAAAAPVSAFTDHAFAGKLGSEVYGAERRKKKKAAAASETNSPDPQTSSGTMLESKNRGSFFPLLGHKRKDGGPLDAAADRRSLMEANQRPNDDPLSPGLSEGAGAALAPDADEAESSEEEEDEMYQGAPTTLLAELQLRKQQQKMRTRPIHKAFPDGMHTTLLEMDAVHEVERKTRKGKQVNLAWEDPALKPAQDDSDDEDLPLGVILAARAAGNTDIAAVTAELNRPLGLMEKKDMEDNEPLSRRRDRLQGRETKPGMFLGGLGPNAANKRQSVLTLTPTIAALQSAGAISPGEQPTITAVEESDDEVEGETLADRRRRLQEKEASELPRARPVSGAFSLELLSHFGDPEEEAKEREKEAAKAAAEREKENAPPEEEETLGQRRRRLQAEKEAREREMGSAELPQRQISRQHSLANVLGAHPFDQARGAADPRMAAQQQADEAEMRKAREKEQKMAMLRAQMPQGLPALNGGVVQPGGFRAGRFNDGTGGGYGLKGMQNDGPGYGHWASQSRQSVAMSGYGQPLGMMMGAPSVYGHNPYAQGIGGMTPQMQQMQMQQMQMQMPMHMQHPQAHVDMVERWRQSVHP